MCTATIVVSLPSLKPLIMRISPEITSNRSTSGNMIVGNRRSLSHPGPARSYAQARKIGDDEMELVLRESRKSSLSPTRTTTATGVHDSKDAVRVTTDVTVTRDML
jgi:hypothetical protein